MFTNSDCIVVIGLQCVELRLKGIEAVGFICDFLLGSIELRLDVVVAGIGIVNGGVVVDDDGVGCRGFPLLSVI